MLPPPKFINLLRQRIDQLSKTIQFLQKQLKIAPQGTLRVSKSHNSLQYYLRDTKNNKNGVYLKKNQKALIQKLAQKSYNIKTLKNIQAELDSASKYYSFLSSNAVNKIRLYQEKGFVIGRDIVFTFETNTTPLTMLYLEKFVKSLFTA